MDVAIMAQGSDGLRTSWTWLALAYCVRWPGVTGPLAEN